MARVPHAVAGSVLGVALSCAPASDSSPASTDASSTGNGDAHAEHSATHDADHDSSGGDDTGPSMPGSTSAHGGQGGSGTGGESSTGGDDGIDPGAPFELMEFDAPHQSVLGARGPGQAWGDIDGDGWLDLVTPGGSAPSLLWHNEHDGTFTLDPSTPDLDAHLDTLGANFVDYDNDGDPDLYLLRHDANVLLRNDGGTWVDVSAATGVDDPASSTAATWGDYDQDGWLDLYVANAGADEDNLYRADGTGHFELANGVLPGRGKLQAYGTTFSDFDDDGDVDLLVVNDKHVGNQMWRNDGPGCGGWCFSDVSAAWNAGMKADSMGVAVGDYDNDGDLDVSITDNNRHNVMRNELGVGGMGFVDASAEAGVLFDAFGWGTIFFDYDNDGWLDLYVADGNIGTDPTSRLFHNEGGFFADATTDCGCNDVGWAFGVSYADYDLDGAVDFVVGYRGSRHELYRNRTQTGHHWLLVELHGAGPVNRDAVGTRVRVVTTSGQSLMRQVKLGSSVASGNSLRLHFGLGDDDIESIEVRWPDGTLEVLAPPPVDGLWVHDYPAP
ncbi:MAG: CRTAC1 family protein [Myxococcota bacterium]